MFLKRICLLGFIIFIFFVSCRKENFITSKDASLQTSADTLFFDTVFTSAGSVTKLFKIFNSNSQKLLLSKVKLMGGSGSNFKLNIDGVSTAEANNIEIAANDSVYVFVQVNVSPSTSTLPFIISDSILINYNGNNKYVQLQAYGQNANFIRSKHISGNVNWNNLLPYVILGGVVIDAGSTLTISSGTHIYCHADAPILVDGTLQVLGTKSAPVIFKGDRLDADYNSFPAAWPGIFFKSNSVNNVMKFALVQNAYEAIVVEGMPSNSNPKLILSQTIIDNSFKIGIFADNSFIRADNTLVSNCETNINIQGGGQYQFTNCTAASYSNIFVEHKNPVLQVTDLGQNGTGDLNASFINCIFWGDNGIVKDEVLISKQGNKNFLVNFDHGIMKIVTDPVNANLISIIKNQDPLFDSINASKRIFDFHTRNPASPANKNGKTVPFLKDLDDKIRVPGAFDLGCYQN